MSLSKYADYRDTNIAWIGSVPKHWGTHRLKWSITDCSNGIWGDEPDGLSDIVCIRVADFDRTSATVNIDSLTFRSIDIHQLAGRKLERGDLLLEKSGGGDLQLVGCVVLFDHPLTAVCSNFVARMRLDEDQCARYWVYAHAALYAARLNYLAIKQTTGIQNLDAAAYLNTVVPYPPCSEQEQIAAFLNAKTAQIDALIAKKTALIEALQEKRLAIISQMVTTGTDSLVRLRETGISSIGRIPTHWKLPALKMRYTVELGKMLDEKRNTGHEPLRYLRNTDVQWDQINTDSLPEMDISEDEYERYTVKENDVLVCEGGDVGRAAIVGQHTGPLGFQKALHRLRADTNEEVPRFIWYTLWWAAHAGVFSVGGTSTIAHLTADQLKQFRFPQPPVAEQQAIADILDEKMRGVSEVIKQVKNAITRLTEYRTALITAATAGQIDVRHIAMPATD